jgi:glycosyltransferase involved in cell wall biosynthesis
LPRTVEPKSVLLCSNIYPPHFVGGAELIAHAQSRVLAGLGHRVSVFAGDPGGSHPRHSIRKDMHEGIPVFRVSLEAPDYQTDYVNFSHPAIDDALDELLERVRPDVLHMHNIIGLSAGIVHRAKRRGIRTVLTVHDHWGFCHKNTLLKSGRTTCRDYSRCAECMPFIDDGAGRAFPMRMRKDFLASLWNEIDCVISPSRYLASAYTKAGVRPEKFRVIWNGVDIKRYSAISRTPLPGKVRFSFIGHFGIHKDVGLILDAMRFVPEATVNLVGTGELLPELNRKMEALRLSSRVRFWGKIDNKRIKDVLAETDVLILPSIWPENQPVSITEAMAARIPVIAARIGGIPELVEHGVTGYVFEPGSAIDLAAKMNELAQSPERRVAMGEAGFRKIEQHALERQVALIVETYEQSPSDSPSPLAPWLVACAGERAGENAAEVMEGLTPDDAREYRFVSVEWLAGDQLERASVLWITDDSIPWSTVRTALSHRVPILTGDTNTEMRALCSRENCGLYYSSPAEAIETLRFLATHEEIRVALGLNGAAYAAVQRGARGAA